MYNVNRRQCTAVRSDTNLPVMCDKSDDHIIPGCLRSGVVAALSLPVSPDQQLVGGGQVAPLGPVQEVLVIRNVVVDQLQLLDGLLKP